MLTADQRKRFEKIVDESENDYQMLDQIQKDIDGALKNVTLREEKIKAKMAAIRNSSSPVVSQSRTSAGSPTVPNSNQANTTSISAYTPVGKK